MNPNTSNNMAEQTKNTATPTSGAQKGSGMTDVSGTQPKAGEREQGTERTDKPGANPSRENTPDVEAKKDAADTRRTSDQSHNATANADTTAKQGDRKDDNAGDAKRTTAEGQERNKADKDAVKNTDTDGQR
jgi:hypothetical protein